MSRIKYKPLIGKIILKGKMEVLTGIHIGGSKETLEIGGIDSPVMRDPITLEPYIPGSSLKGKMRYLFERKENKEFNRSGGSDTYRHECCDRSCEVCRVFGSTVDKKDKNYNPDTDNNIPSRLYISDMRLDTESAEKLSEIDTGLLYTEWKFENSIDRVTAAANPRQLERVPAGSAFNFEIVYDVETEEINVKQDINNILTLFALLEDDYLGGHGSRGYGRVQFKPDSFESRKIAYYDNNDQSEVLKVDFSKGNSIETCRKNLTDVVSFINYNLLSVNRDS